MTDRASDFLRNWVTKNVVAVAGDQRVSEAGLLALGARDAAVEIGIREAELVAAAGGDLDSFMIEALASPEAVARSQEMYGQDD